MTSARARDLRIENDAYYTPDVLADVLVAKMAPKICKGDRIVEPSVGGGAFARAIRKHAPGAHLIGIDNDAAAAGLDLCDEAIVGDWCAWEGQANWVFGNPPFSCAEEHLAHALQRSEHVAMLLRLAFLEGMKRFRWWQEHGPRLHHVYVLAERPSFTGGSSDSAAYGWFVFGLWPRSGAKIDVLSWRDGERLAGCGYPATADLEAPPRDEAPPQAEAPTEAEAPPQAEVEPRSSRQIWNGPKRKWTPGGVVGA